MKIWLALVVTLGTFCTGQAFAENAIPRQIMALAARVENGSINDLAAMSNAKFPITAACVGVGALEGYGNEAQDLSISISKFEPASDWRVDKLSQIHDLVSEMYRLCQSEKSLAINQVELESALKTRFETLQGLAHNLEVPGWSDLDGLLELSGRFAENPAYFFPIQVHEKMLVGTVDKGEYCTLDPSQNITLVGKIQPDAKLVTVKVLGRPNMPSKCKAGQKVVIEVDTLLEMYIDAVAHQS